MVQDSFQVQTQGFPGSLTGVDNIMHGLAGQASHNTSWNAETHAEPMIDNKVPKNLEQTLFSLEDHFWYILNNPICYSEIIWRFFGKHSLFCMFPHVEAFFRTYRLTGNPHNVLPNGGPNNIIRASPGSMVKKLSGTEIGLLEEIVETNEEHEPKKGKFSVCSKHPNNSIALDVLDTITTSEQNQEENLKSKSDYEHTGGQVSGSPKSGPSDSNERGVPRTDSNQTGTSFQVVTDFPYQPIDLIEWVQIRVRAINNKILIGQNSNPYTEYEMEETQRIESITDKNTIKITRHSGDPDNQSNFELKSCHLKFGVKDLFQMIMFYCQSFTDDDIPDKLWQEAEYGITQQGNDNELEDLLNYKIFKNLEVIMHPAMRNFFEIGRERYLTNNNLNQQSLNTASQQAQNEDFIMNRLRSSSLGFGDSANNDRLSSTSQRWQSNMMP